MTVIGTCGHKLGEVKQGKKIGYPQSTTAPFIWHACIDCGKERWVQFRRGKPISLRCRRCAKMGKRHSQWKGGRIEQSDGYILIWLEPKNFFYSMANHQGYVLEHRLIVAKALGRCLHRWEIIHHKGVKYPKGSIENKQDNQYPENLQLVSDDRHLQITILENRISTLEKRITLLEAENTLLQLKGQEVI